MTFDRTLSVEIFCRMFGVTDLPESCATAIAGLNLRYRVLSRQERDEHILGILHILEGELTSSGPSRKPRWEQGWRENLNEYIASGGDQAALIPGYYRRGVGVMRLFDEYILPQDPWFEVSCLKVLQLWLCETYLQEVSTVYEFGCGPAHNLYAFAQREPAKKYYGLDWTTASQELIEKIAENTEFDMHGINFDMFDPPRDLITEPGSLLITIGMMEQAGKNFLPFFDFLMRQDARLFVHVEPIRELHDPHTLEGYLALRYMKKRNYLEGYLKHLKSMESNGALKIEKTQPILGSANFNGWNLIVWRKA